MKSALFFLVPMALLAFFMAGGLSPFSIQRSFVVPPSIPKPSQTFTLLDKGGQYGNSSLQLGALQPASCQAGSGKAAIEMVVDSSSSMLANNKLEKLKQATNYFFTLLSPTDVIGVFEFGSNMRQIIPIEMKTVNETIFEKAIKKIEVVGNAGTPTARGLDGALTQITTAFPKYSDYTKIAMLVTDGCPNAQDVKTVKDKAQAIKNLGVRVVTVGIELGGAPKCKDKAITSIGGAEKLMQDIASSPDDAYVAGSADQLQAIYESITKTFGCSAKAPVPSPTNVCLGTPSHVDLLLDVSGSMEPNMDALKTSVKNFAHKLEDSTIVGVQDFSGGGPRGAARETIPIGQYGVSKAVFDGKIDGLSEDQDGYTYMKDGFDFAKQKIDASPQGIDYNKWTLIFLSDGTPETKGVRPDPSQNPTNIANEMKSKGAKIVTIALGNKADKNLMQSLATSTSDFFDASSASDLDAIYQRIAGIVSCQ